MLISIQTHITCDFPGGGGGGLLIPYTSSGSAHIVNRYEGIGHILCI